MRTVPFDRNNPDRGSGSGFADELNGGGGRTEFSSRWTDEKGHGPLRRFLRPDDPQVLYPTRRIVLFLFLGSCLSTVGVQLTNDEYYEGPQEQFILFDEQLYESSLLVDAAGFNSTEAAEMADFFPVHIAFNDIGCSISGLERPILSNMTGEIRPKKLTGIMGPTGSGKTTFSWSLLGRSKRYCTAGAHGNLYLNGRPRNLEAFLDRVGFVPQDDVLYPDLTVEEALMFSANWRLPRDMTQEQKQEVVQHTMEVLDLLKVRDRRIGDVQSRSISGGERKRTSIGMELVSKPAVLVMDEPTSGLDSAGTFRLMEMLQKVAHEGVSVVAVIHQPSARVFELLDDLILMQNGEAAYIGPRSDVQRFLEEMGYPFQRETSSSMPLAEFLLDVVTDLEKPKGPPHPIDVSHVCKGGSYQEQSCISIEDNQTHPMLPSFFREHVRRKRMWEKIEAKMKRDRQREDLLRCIEFKAAETYNADGSLRENRTRLASLIREWRKDCRHISEKELSRMGIGQESAAIGYLRTLLEWCGITPCELGDTGMWCNMLDARSALPSYQQRPKPGLKRQVYLWFWHIVMLLKWRRGVAVEIFVIATLALVVSFVRSFNTTWNRRAVSNLFLSISIGLLGMGSAVLNDDVAPAQRAASAGMLLGAHEFAVLAETLIWGWCVCHVYSIFYFVGLWMRNGVWIIDLPLASVKNSHPCDLTSWVRLQKYYEFAHLLHLNFLGASALGKAICVFANHKTSISYVGSVAMLIGCHVFAFFTPNQNQVRNEATIFGGSINVSPLVETICAMSYVRYFLEAIFLWDPSPRDPNGRKYVLRYFDYHDCNKTHCATWLFSLGIFAQAVRFVIFSFRNSNDFHSLHDTPLFLIFIFKVLSCHVVALLLMTLIQEWYFPWVSSLQEKIKNEVGDDVVDIVDGDSLKKYN